MEYYVLKTLKWSDCTELISRFFQSLASHGTDDCQNFVDLARAFPQWSTGLFLLSFKEMIRQNFIPDVTEEAKIYEDTHLFAMDTGSALDIIMTYLVPANEGKEHPALWCFLDIEKNAVVHFVKQDGWFVEIFFEDPSSQSYAHLVEDKNQKRSFIVTVFKADMSEEIALAEKNGSFFLRQYPPRVVGEFLRRRGTKKQETAPNVPSNPHPRRDRGDCL